jgi:hypothetical protein
MFENPQGADENLQSSFTFFFYLVKAGLKYVPSENIRRFTGIYPQQPNGSQVKNKLKLA